MQSRKGGGWIYIKFRAVTEHPITAVVWSDILRQSETPGASLHNGGTNIPMSMSKWHTGYRNDVIKTRTPLSVTPDILLKNIINTTMHEIHSTLHKRGLQLNNTNYKQPQDSFTSSLYCYYYYYYYYYPRCLLYAGYPHLYSWDKPWP
jgi:hypothetical protein